MKTHFMLITLCFISLTAFGQELQLEKASPFTAVKWSENDQPVVQYNNEWYKLEKLDIHTTKELLDFSKHEYGSNWKKRFSEDLVDVLKEMGTPPDKKVKLLLSDEKQQIWVMGKYTLENRQKVYDYNKENKDGIKKRVEIAIPEALADIDEFQQVLEEQSSYVHLSDYDYEKAINSLKAKVVKSQSAIDVNFLTCELAKIMAEIGDRHSSVKNNWIENHPSYSLQLPFSIASLNGKAVALQQTGSNREYNFLHVDFPFIKTINNFPISVMIDSLVYRSKKAPEKAKFTRGVSEIQQFGRLYLLNNLEVPKQVKIVFTNGTTDTTECVQLVNKESRFYSKVEWNTYLKGKEVEKGNFQGTSKKLLGNIGYLSIPRMYNLGDKKDFEKFIDSTLTSFKHTKAIVIDLRFNPGGTRDLMQQFAGYIVPPAQSPWIANVAFLRTNENKSVHRSMSNRFLYTYSSEKLDGLDRNSIEAFSKRFAVDKEFDRTKFSSEHYMILKSGEKHYTKPVYILVNELSFSAATVFTSAFKELPNVKVVGVTTDGSSGNSKTLYLKHSNIRVKVSTMLSFQRNGKTLDGNGTKPDLCIPVEQEQVLKGIDVQLEKLISLINTQ